MHFGLSSVFCYSKYKWNINIYFTDQPICTSFEVAEINDGSPFFLCPLLENADNETECCGEAGQQVCCAPTDEQQQ